MKGRVISGQAVMLMLGLLATAGQGMAAGISFNHTRLVYHQGSGSEAITAKNGGAQLYLLQSGVITTSNGQTPGPFWVTPPIARLEGHTQNTLRIVGKPDLLAALPQDRESLFYFFSTAIPAQPAPLQEGRATMAIGLRTLLKLFYRPKGLPGDPDTVVNQLQLTRQGERIIIHNPTPYYASLAELTLNNKAIDLDNKPSMIAPYGELDFTGLSPVHQVSWRLMTDYGGVTEKHQVNDTWGSG